MSGLSKQELQTFMETRFLCVISTVTAEARPEAAFVGYASNSDQEVLIGTSNKTRKFKNISHNKSVALVIADNSGEVQYEGEAEVLTQAEYGELVAQGQFTAIPGFDKYRNDPTEVVLKIRPTWIRFIIHGPPGANADQIKEFTDFA